jgi:hypothetical protein
VEPASQRANDAMIATISVHNNATSTTPAQINNFTALIPFGTSR